MTPSTAARRMALRNLVREHDIERQSDLVDLLHAAGYPVTQATVSRDLAAIGAVKERVGGGTRYVIPPPGNGQDELGPLRRALADFVEEIVPSGNLVVLRTPPGAAQIVASAIDQAGLASVLGTVAGDDTILAVAADESGGWRVARQLEQIGGGR